jgi:hypothetical protein
MVRRKLTWTPPELPVHQGQPGVTVRKTNVFICNYGKNELLYSVKKRTNLNGHETFNYNVLWLHDYITCCIVHIHSGFINNYSTKGANHLIIVGDEI